MGLLEIASGNSFWRGYDYYERGKIKTCQKIDSQHYKGTVEGSGGRVYQVSIDLEHPKKSTCTCPHAEGTRRVCKHKVALYFSFFPEAADKAIKEAEEWEKQEEERWEAECKEIEEYVNSLTKQELREELLWRLLDEKEKSRWY